MMDEIYWYSDSDGDNGDNGDMAIAMVTMVTMVIWRYSDGDNGECFISNLTKQTQGGRADHF